MYATSLYDWAMARRNEDATLARSASEGEVGENRGLRDPRLRFLMLRYFGFRIAVFLGNFALWRPRGLQFGAVFLVRALVFPRKTHEKKRNIKTCASG